tara:strand:- start:479 stop:643 length:165 start_codon:yes stop_codon:yes gene_type:complete
MKNIIPKKKIFKIISRGVASSAGLEPATRCLEGSCSNPTELRGEKRGLYSIFKN